LTTELLDRLTELVGCEYATYEDFNWSRRNVTAYVPCSNSEETLAVDPPYVPEDEDYWTGGESRYPRSLHWNGRRFDKLSDRFGRRRRERLRDEEDYNREFRIVDRIGFLVGGAPTRNAWLHFDSQGRDFDERDRAVMFALRPHLHVLWRKAVARRQLAELTSALGRDGDAAISRAVVLYEADGRIDHATAEAHRLLAAWFAARTARLPPKLVEWAANARPGDQYSERRNDSILTVTAAGDFMLTLTESCSANSSLTRREREVLHLVAEGLTNAEIAQQLWVTPATIAKHLEQAYRKLGVHRRTAAVARLAKPSD
jgi:DNA-binding CsgD family transcriptional regulator